MLFKLFRYSIVPFVISLIILYLCCFIPGNDIPDVELEFLIPIDKIVHFCMYLGLSGATAINYIYGKKGHININKLIIGAFLLPIIYGGVIEILQDRYFEGRSGDWFDFLADLLGSLAAYPIALYYRKYLLNKQIAK